MFLRQENCSGLHFVGCSGSWIGVDSFAVEPLYIEHRAQSRPLQHCFRWLGRCSHCMVLEDLDVCRVVYGSSNWALVCSSPGNVLNALHAERRGCYRKSRDQTTFTSLLTLNEVVLRAHGCAIYSSTTSKTCASSCTACQCLTAVMTSSLQPLFMSGNAWIHGEDR